MMQSALFSSGFGLSPFLTSSGLVNRSWNAISSSSGEASRGNRLSWRVHKEPDTDLTIIAFEATSVSNPQQELVTSSALKNEGFDRFEFLCTKSFPVVSFNSASINLFKDNRQMLDHLKSQITSSTTLVVTGRGLGGSIASLFTLSLLDSIGTGKNRPLSITFGSPLIGDKKLQLAISLSSTWNSCFVQVVSIKDPLPTLFIKNQAGDYMPFGTFLFCSDGNSTCVENPDSILKLLNEMAKIQGQNQEHRPSDYANIVQNLPRRAICKDLAGYGMNLTQSSSLQACLNLQLWALGLIPQVQNTDLVATMEKQEINSSHKRTSFDPTKKLNTVKMEMAKLEWYKKKSKDLNMGYYDSYKLKGSTSDQDVIQFSKSLKIYWKRMVKEAEMKPQKEGASFRTRWLYAGTNYRRMVEPLDIADYYRGGGRNYVTEGRSDHYKVLEEWLNEARTATSDSNSSKNVESILTFDSCFWAHVEEALLLLKQFNDAAHKDEASRKSLEFQEYVYGLLSKYQVSSEIFLVRSSYMKWWDEYSKIVGAPLHQQLEKFMKDCENYKKGTYNFS